MELVTKKRLASTPDVRIRRSPRRSPSTSASSSVTPNLTDFANGEMHCRFGESIRGADVFIDADPRATPGCRSTTRSWSS